MKIEEYKDLASRTLAHLGDHKKDMSHMALGIVSEWGEMAKAGMNEDHVNVIEEHGDTNWFVACMCKLYNLGFTEIYNDADVKFEKTHENEMFLSMFKVAGHVKDYLAYDRTIDRDELRKELVFVVSYLKVIAKEEKFDYMESLQKNIDKLRVRFPDRFTEEKANNRDLSAERETLKN